jgi:hypothetical protein
MLFCSVKPLNGRSLVGLLSPRSQVRFLPGAQVRAFLLTRCTRNVLLDDLGFPTYGKKPPPISGGGVRTLDVQTCTKSRTS